MLVLLGVVIGVSFVYLLLALICTTVNEWIAGVFGLRRRTLEAGIRQLLGRETEGFYEHPLIKGLSPPGKRPSYIPAHIFSSAVLHMGPSQPVHDAVAALKPTVTRGAPADNADAAALEDWFNNAMDRVSGTYKRRMQLLTVATAVAVTFVTNADTLQIIGVLWRSPALRADIVEQARQRLAGPRPATTVTYPDVNNPVPPVDEPATAEEEIANAITADERTTLDQIIGWSADFRRVNQGVCSALQSERALACADSAISDRCRQVLQRIDSERRCTVDATALTPTDASPGAAFLSGSLVSVAGMHAFGWFLTIAAISLGAAFWFDTLHRVINMRSTGPSPNEKRKRAQP